MRWRSCTCSPTLLQSRTVSGRRLGHARHGRRNRHAPLRRPTHLLPITFVTFGLGYLAIIGVPPFAGYFSKDAIIETAFNSGGLEGWLLGGAALLGAGITAFYMTRVMLLTFFGQRRWKPDTHPHESPASMTAPMIILAIGSVGAGALLAIGSTLQHWLEPVVGHHETEHLIPPAWIITVTALGVVAIGIAVAVRMYLRKPVNPIASEWVSAATVAALNDLYGDAFNEAALMRPGRAVTRGTGCCRAAGDRCSGGRYCRSGGSGVELGASHANRVCPLLRAVDLSGCHSGGRDAGDGEAVMNQIPWLSLLWLIPLTGAGLIAILPATTGRSARFTGLAVAIGVLVIAIVIAVRFDPAGEQFQFVEKNHPWIPSFGTGYILGVDGIALALVVLTAVLVPLLIIAGWHDADGRSRSVNAYVALTLAVEGMVLLALVALDILLFFIFFEAMLIPMYFLIGGFGGAGRSRAALKFLVYSLCGGLAMLAAVIGLYVLTSRSTAFDGGTFDYRAIADAVTAGTFTVNPAVAHALFLGFLIAFAVKAPLWPFSHLATRGPPFRRRRRRRC